MKIQLIRNACLVISIGAKNLLVDPMLATKNSYPPVQNTANTLLNPLVDLPLNAAALTDMIFNTDAVLLTHLHNDHWDAAARELLPKDVIIFCQPEDAENLRGQGFTAVRPVDKKLEWNSIQITRTGGQHGTGDIAKRLAPVSGYLLQFESECLYIAGDTIWCDEVKHAIDLFKPRDIIVNGGGARFVTGDPIVMDLKDIVTVCNHSPLAKVYVVHLEAVNHSMESGQLIKEMLAGTGLQQRCCVPEDGETFIG